MLFYEPLFLFVFLPAAFAVSLRLRHSPKRRLLSLLAAPFTDRRRPLC